jgi:hypothetical protein
MHHLPFADAFLAGALLSLLLPVGLLVAIATWYVFAVQRVPADTPASSPALPPEEVVQAAGPEAVSEVTPSGHPRVDEPSADLLVDQPSGDPRTDEPSAGPRADEAAGDPRTDET